MGTQNNKVGQLLLLFRLRRSKTTGHGGEDEFAVLFRQHRSRSEAAVRRYLTIIDYVGLEAATQNPIGSSNLPPDLLLHVPCVPHVCGNLWQFRVSYLRHGASITEDRKVTGEMRRNQSTARCYVDDSPESFRLMDILSIDGSDQ